MNYILVLAIIALLAAAWYAWQYYKLRRAVNQFASRVRMRDTSIDAR